MSAPVRSGRGPRPVAAVVLAAALAGPLAAQPVPADDAPSAARGRSLYTSYCARCHGVNLVNTGASFDLRTFPKDQPERFERSVTQGLRAMPAWGGTLQPAEVASLWLFVSSHPGS